MATFQKRGDTWRAIVRKKGISMSETFPTKTAAQIWATQTEAEILAGKDGIADKTFGDLLERYWYVPGFAPNILEYKNRTQYHDELLQFHIHELW